MNIDDLSTWDVLAVDDELANLDILSYIFSFHQVKLRLAVSGTMALRLIQERQPSIVLLDLRMPGMSGWDVIDQIRGNPLLKSLPVVAVTAQVMDNDKEALWKAGFNGYIAKPISPLGFVNVLKSALTTSESAT